MDRSFWSSKYVVGGITGFAACVNALSARSVIGATLAAASVICLSAMWYFTGRSDATEEHLESLGIQIDFLNDLKKQNIDVTEKLKALIRDA